MANGRREAAPSAPPGIKPASEESLQAFPPFTAYAFTAKTAPDVPIWRSDPPAPYYRQMTTLTEPTSNDAGRGSIAVVGLGMTLGSHLTPLARSHIEQADVVFAGLSDGIVEHVAGTHASGRTQPAAVLRRGHKSRMQTYRQWVDVMMAEVRAGKKSAPCSTATPASSPGRRTR